MSFDENTVRLWYQRESGDFKVAIASEADGYRVTVIERDERDPQDSYDYVFEDFDQVVSYLHRLNRLITDDQDRDSPFTHFQYSIPYFPSVLVSLPTLQEKKGHFGHFVNALKFYFH